MLSINKRWSQKEKAGTQVWCSDSASKLPCYKIALLLPDIFASYSGPDEGLTFVHYLYKSQENIAQENQAQDIAGAQSWNQKSRKAYGICMSLYDQHPINGTISGDPIADAFAICARKNNALMVVADGVNWGEKSKLAARCAIYGSMCYLSNALYVTGKSINTTQETFSVMLRSLDVAHETILEYDGGLTTLCVALICPLKNSKQFAVCIVNVGDSLGFVFSKHHGIREITTGSHDIQSERDIRDAGGALGPVNGKDPELNNLTCSMTVVDPGDIVFLTTDGISDNFDPVVTKIAIAKRRHSDPEVNRQNTVGLGISPHRHEKPEMAPHERHQYAVKEMERIIHEFELYTEVPCSAQELCGAMLQHVLTLTDPKRKVLENPDLYGKKLRQRERKRRDSELVCKMSLAPGKLDHATICAYEVGTYHGNDDEDYEAQSVGEMDCFKTTENITDEQNNVIIEETEDSVLASERTGLCDINEVHLLGDPTFQHLHDVIPFADEDENLESADAHNTGNNHTTDSHYTVVSSSDMYVNITSSTVSVGKDTFFDEGRKYAHNLSKFCSSQADSISKQDDMCANNSQCYTANPSCTSKTEVTKKVYKSSINNFIENVIESPGYSVDLAQKMPEVAIDREGTTCSSLDLDTAIVAQDSYSD